MTTPRLRAARLAALALVASALIASVASAQTEGVLLQIRPHKGDTLFIRTEQKTVLTGKRVDGDEPATTTTTETRVWSRAIAEDTVAGGTIVRTITDSVKLTSSDEHATARSEEMEKALRGQTMRFRLAYDGTMAPLDTGSAARDLSSLASIMPGAFPTSPIKPGATWMREMPLPGGNRIAATSDAPGGWLHAKFRFDSLGKRGAYLSMRGEMSTDADPKSESDQPVLEGGRVTGTMFVDRKRGWMAESRVEIVVRAVTRTAGAETMRFETRVTQHMRTIFGSRE